MDHCLNNFHTGYTSHHSNHSHILSGNIFINIVKFQNNFVLCTSIFKLVYHALEHDATAIYLSKVNNAEFFWSSQHNLRWCVQLSNLHFHVLSKNSSIRLAALIKPYHNLASSRENLSSGVCEQHRHRPACASAHSYQRLCCSLFGKHNM